MFEVDTCAQLSFKLHMSFKGVAKRYSYYELLLFHVKNTQNPFTYLSKCFSYTEFKWINFLHRNNDKITKKNKTPFS